MTSHRHLGAISVLSLFCVSCWLFMNGRHPTSLPSIAALKGSIAHQQPFNRSKLAILIETESLPHLSSLLLHTVAVLPPEWPVLFFGSNTSAFSVARTPAISRHASTGKLTISHIPHPWVANNTEGLFRMLTDASFYDEVLPGVEWLLRLSQDSVLCANSKASLNEWLQWDWSGAKKSTNGLFSGYGGLSLRRVSTIKRILQFQQRRNDTEPEDEWFAKRLISLPPSEQNFSPKPFSVESIYSEEPMGYYIGNSLDGEMWQDPQSRRRIFHYCPEVSLVLDMKLERERCPEPQGALAPK